MKQKGILIFGFILMLGLLILLNALSVEQRAESPDSELDPNRSTYNTDRTGLHAFFTLLSETGRKPTRWQNKTSELDARDAPHTLFVVGPLKKNLTGDERSDILQWVARGGRLVLVDRQPDPRLLDPSGIDKLSVTLLRPPGSSLFDPEAEKEPAANIAAARPVQPTEITAGVGSIQPSRFAGFISLRKTGEPEAESANAPDAEDEPTPEFTQVFADHRGSVSNFELEGKPILITRKFGAGSVIVLTDPFILSNRGIALLDNAQLGMNLAASSNGTVAFDEFHHGFGSNQNRMAEYFSGTPVVAVFFQLLLIAAVILFSQSRRFARPIDPKEPDRLSKLEYLSAMAELQRRTKAYDIAVENVYREFRRRVSRLVGVDAKSVSHQELARLVANRSGKSADEIEALLYRAEDVMHDVRPDPEEASKVIVEIRELEKILKLTRRRANVR